MNASSACLSVFYPPGTACRKLSNPSFCRQISIYFRSKIIRRIGLTQIPVHIARLKQLSEYPSTLVIRLPNTIVNIPITVWIQPNNLAVITKASSSRPPDAPTWVCEAIGRGCIFPLKCHTTFGACFLEISVDSSTVWSWLSRRTLVWSKGQKRLYCISGYRRELPVPRDNWYIPTEIDKKNLHRTVIYSDYQTIQRQKGTEGSNNSHKKPKVSEDYR